MDNLSNLPPRCLQSISSFSKSPEMPERTEELHEKNVKRIEEPAISLKKIAQLEDDLVEMKKDKEMEMSRLATKMVQIEANLKIVKLEADLVDERERNRELERKMAETKRKNDDLEAQLRTQNTEVREGKTKIGELEGKINALQSKNSGLETQIQIERENKTGRNCEVACRFKSNDESLGSGWMVVFGKNRFLVIEQEMTFDQAEAYCASQEGHLVTIHSQEENDFVQKLARTVPWYNHFWIGLKSNPNKQNAFEWTDGSSVDFTNWDEGEPDSYTHALLWCSDGKWGAYPPTNPYRSICKSCFQF